jgi:SAM-dependent methyltransferase
MDTGTARRRVAAGLDTLGVLGPLTRLREHRIAARAPEAPAIGADGVPMPPARLRVLVDGHGLPDGFVEDGTEAARMIRETLASAGVDLADLGAILDFGCGCGRVARHWVDVRGPEIHGCDYNAELAGWCEENLPFVRARVNGAKPPSPYDDDSFDLVYAISILTHLTEPVADAWMADFERILRPGGLLLVTTHGDGFTERLTPAERERYERGEPVVQRAGVEGTNTCAAYHPPDYVRDRLLARFEPAGPDFAVPSTFPQDVYLARLPG